MTREMRHETERETTARDNVSRQVRYVYLVIVIYAIVIGYPSTHAAEQGRKNCLATRASNAQINAYIATQTANAAKSNLLTPEQKAERVEQASHIHLYEPRSCPGAWPWEH
jgi:uncharacterized protein (UPF0333 family)